MNENEIKKNDVDETAEAPKKDLAEEYNTIFDQNVAPVDEPVNREYIKRIFGDDLHLKTDEIRMTRSSYVQELMEITEYFKKERRDCLKLLLADIVILLVLALMTKALTEIDKMVLNIYLHALLNGARMLCGFSTLFFPSFILGSIIKKYKKHVISEKHALESLEERKKECMLLGVYDAGR